MLQQRVRICFGWYLPALVSRGSSRSNNKSLTFFGEMSSQGNTIGSSLFFSSLRDDDKTAKSQTSSITFTIHTRNSHLSSPAFSFFGFFLSKSLTSGDKEVRLTVSYINCC